MFQIGCCIQRIISIKTGLVEKAAVFLKGFLVSTNGFTGLVGNTNMLIFTRSIRWNPTR